MRRNRCEAFFNDTTQQFSRPNWSLSGVFKNRDAGLTIESERLRNTSKRYLMQMGYAMVFNPTATKAGPRAAAGGKRARREGFCS